VDANGLNPTAIYLNAGELRSNGLVKDEVRKSATGYEILRKIDPADGSVLADPVTEPIAAGGLLNSNSNGTAYFEPAIADAGVYGTDLDVQLTDYPISTLESITKRVNGVDVVVNPATAVIAIDGLSFTHPDLTSGDLVTFIYLYDIESINRAMTLTHYDSRFVLVDSVDAKVYRIEYAVAGGVLSTNLIEI
jgi:hypothetical protein